MPADRLDPDTTPATTTAKHEHLVDATEAAVLRVLTGSPAEHTGVEGVDVAEAVRLYRAAGRQALHDQLTTPWWHIYVEFPDWHSSEEAAAHHVARLLVAAEHDRVVGQWWFLRKHPCWRLRLRPGPAGERMKTTVGLGLDRLTAEGVITGWRPGIYEPETAAFGGTAAMQVVHTLFWRDSHEILHLFGGQDPGLGRREATVLLCTVLLRAAGLEYYEQGDVWDRVARERPPLAETDQDRLAAVANDLGTLMRADLAPGGQLFGTTGSLSALASWADAYRHAGTALGDAARAGTLERGLREVLCYLVLFVWNRLGLSGTTQRVIAQAARNAILDIGYQDSLPHE